MNVKKHISIGTVHGMSKKKINAAGTEKPFKCLLFQTETPCGATEQWMMLFQNSNPTSGPTFPHIVTNESNNDSLPLVHKVINS